MPAAMYLDPDTGQYVYLPGGSSGATDHDQLTGRSTADQHPISAVTGLQAALDGKAPSAHTHPESGSALYSAPLSDPPAAASGVWRILP